MGLTFTALWPATPVVPDPVFPDQVRRDGYRAGAPSRAWVLERTIGLGVSEEVQVEGYDRHHWGLTHEESTATAVPSREPAKPTDVVTPSEPSSPSGDGTPRQPS